MLERCRGFTLAELLLVAVVLSVVALVALPGLSTSGGNKVALASSEVAEALRFARSEALRTGVHHGMRVTSDKRRARVFWLDTGTVPPTEYFTVRHPMDKKIYDIDVTEGFFTGGVEVVASFEYEGGGAEQWAVAFDERGEPVAPDDLDPLLSGSVTVTDGVATNTVTVAPIVGRITVQ